MYAQTYRPSDPVLQSIALKLLARVCNDTPFYELYCNMEKNAADIALQGMK